MTTERDGIVEKATAEKEARVGEPEKGIIVSDSLGRLIQVCVRLLSQEEYKTFSRKISKYLSRQVILKTNQFLGGSYQIVPRCEFTEVMIFKKSC